jgi:hypothetical protein
MAIYFSQDGKKRTVFKTGELEKLANLISASTPTTYGFTLNKSWSDYGSGSYNELSGSFSPIAGLGELKLRLQYVVSGLADSVSASISGTAYLTDNSGNNIKTLGDFNFLVTGLLGMAEIVFYPSGVISSGTYRIRVQGSYSDFSTDINSDPAPGTFTIGGTNNDTRSFTVTPDAILRTEIADDGLFSFWGPDAYLYLSPSEENYSIQWRSKFILRDAVSGSYIRSLPGGGIDLNRQGGGSIRVSNLPSSSPGGSWNLWRDGSGYLRVT